MLKKHDLIPTRKFPIQKCCKKSTKSYVFDENFLFPSIKSSFCYVHSMPLGGEGGGRLLPKVTQKKEEGNEIYNIFPHDEEGEKEKREKKTFSCSGTQVVVCETRCCLSQNPPPGKRKG